MNRSALVLALVAGLGFTAIASAQPVDDNLNEQRDH